MARGYEVLQPEGFDGSNSKGLVGTPCRKEIIWSDTTQVEEASDVHWCNPEVTCGTRTTLSTDEMMHTSVPKKKSLVKRFWKIGVFFLGPILLSPLYFITTMESRCGFVVALMALYWMTETLPLAVTALLPVVLLPSLGIMSADETCRQYLVETNMLFVASLGMAITLEHCNLHRRIALRVMLCVGTDPKWVMLGFMLTTMFLSLWICNTSTTAMMMPIVDAVLAEILTTRCGPDDPELASSSQRPNEAGRSKKGRQWNGNSEKELLNSRTVYPEYHDRQKRERHLAEGLYLSVAYAANIGGTATLTSAGPNLILKFIMDEYYDSRSPVDYASWIVFAAPGVICTVLLVWAAFQLLYLFNKPFGLESRGHAAKKAINEKYEELGPMTFHEAAVLGLFITMVLLWMFRDPHFMRGWANLFHYGSIKPKDSTCAMFIIVLLFVVPSKPSRIGNCPSLISWQIVQHRLPWGVVLLRGGGFAMAEATKRSGLSAWMGRQLAVLNFLQPSWMALAISSIVALLTEFITNSATATIFLPIVASLANDLHINPLCLLIPVTLACSYAFMLPVGTPANTVVAAHARLRTSDMLLPGAIVKLISICTMLVSMNTLGRLIYSLDFFLDRATDSVLSAATNMTSEAGGH